MDWLFGYLLGRKKEREGQERHAAELRFAYVQALRSRDGLPLLPADTPLQPITPGRPWVALTWRGVRRLALALALLLLVFVVVFVVYAIGYGVQHHLIYPVRQ